MLPEFKQVSSEQWGAHQLRWRSRWRWCYHYTCVWVLLTVLLFGLLHRSCVGRRSPAGWTAWPTSAPASPSSRAASQRSGWRRQPCRATSASGSTRRSRGTQRMRSPPPPLPPPQPQAPREPVDIPGSKLCPVCSLITFSSLVYYFFLAHPFTHLGFSVFFTWQRRGRKTPTEEEKLQTLFRGLPRQLLAKTIVNSNAELRGVATKLNSPPGILMLLDPWRTADSLRHESTHRDGGHHTVTFLLWSSFIFLSLPPPT